MNSFVKKYTEMKKLYLLIFTLPFLIFCCKDKEEIIRNVDPERKEWGLFQKGTWWVYEEENTRAIDSFWVDSVEISFFKNDDFDYNKYEQIITLVNSNDNNSKSYALTLSSRTTLIKVLTFINFDRENSNSSIIVSIPLSKGKRFSACKALKWAELDSIYDSLKISGNTFHNVTRVYDMCNSAYKNQPTYFYCAKNIGIVRKEFPEMNEIWNLKRLNIVQ